MTKSKKAPAKAVPAKKPAAKPVKKPVPAKKASTKDAAPKTTKARKTKFKPSAWWKNASDARKKAYVLRHPRGNYAKLFANTFKLDYDPKSGLDESKVKAVEVEPDPSLPDDGNPAKIKVDFDEKDIPTLDEEVKDDLDETDDEPAKDTPPADKLKVREANIRRGAAQRLQEGAKHVTSKIRNKLGPKAEEAEAALTGIKEGKSVDSKKMGSLGKTAKLMGIAALALLGGVAMFTPLAPVAFNLGAEYMAHRFGNMSQSSDLYEAITSEWLAWAGTDEELASVSADLPGNLEEMFADMADWLSSQDVDALATKLKANG